MNGKNSLLVLALLLVFLLPGFSSADISVSISPKNKATEVLKLYPDEVGELEVTISNDGTEPLENINLRVSVGEPLSIMKEGTATPALNHRIASLGPEQSEYLFVMVKPKELMNEKQFVYVNYGFETFTHIVATYVEIVESPLEVQARLAKSALDMGEPSKLALTLRNKGNEAISNIRAELVLPPGLSHKDSALEADFLSPGESIADREFAFDVDPSVVGEKKLILLVSFEDAGGRHALERDFLIDIQNRRIVLYMIIGAIIALVVVSLYLRRKPSKSEKPLEQPEVKELDGKKIEAVPIKGKEIRR